MDLDGSGPRAFTGGPAAGARPIYLALVTRWIRTPDDLKAFARSLEGLPGPRPRQRVGQPLPPLREGLPRPDRHRPGRGLSSSTRSRCATSRPSRPLMADPGLVKVLHGADYDVTTLKRDFGFSFAAVFDTMIAARFLGLPEIGLQARGRGELGVALSKDSQKDDWSRRPLTATQEAYALADVQHLLALRDRLASRSSARRAVSSWVREECDAVAALEPARRRQGPGRLPEGQGGARVSAPRPRRPARALRLARGRGRGQRTLPPSRSSATRRSSPSRTKPPRDPTRPARRSEASCPRLRRPGARPSWPRSAGP